MIDADPLFETNFFNGKHVCLLCASSQATSMLLGASLTPVVPMCQSCSARWNMYGYRVLKFDTKKFQMLMFRLFKYKLFHPFSLPTPLGIIRDIVRMIRWGRKMTAFAKHIS